MKLISSLLPIIARKKFNIRQYFFISVIIYILGITTYLVISYFLINEEINEKINQQLIKAARSVDYLLPLNYHDRATSRKSISEIEFNEIMQILSQQANNLEVKYIYSMIENNGRLFFTSSSATSYEIRTGQNLTYYWQEYVEADPRFYEALKSMKITFLDYTDRWGTFRSVLIPKISPAGNKYLLGADVEISYIDKTIWRGLLFILLKALFFTLIILPFFYVYHKYYKITKDHYTKTLSQKELKAVHEQDLRKQSFLKYQQIDEKYEALLNHINIPTIVLDVKGKVIEVNHAFLEYIGKTQYDIKDNIIFTIPFFQSVNEFEELINLTQKNHILKNYPLTLYSKKGESSCKVTCILLNKQEKQQFLILINDITQENKYLQEIAKAKLLMEEMLQRKSLFIATMSHEMRTPLNVIIGFLEILRDENVAEDLKNEYLQVIQSNAEHLLALINDIIDFSKIEAGQFTVKEGPFYLNYNLNQYKLWLIEEIKRKNLNIDVVLTIPLDDQESIIYTDELRVKQVITNLLTNALKFTESGTIEFGYKVVGSYIEIYVSDTGPGMNEEEINNLFNFYIQGVEGKKSKYKGFGLGLAISKKIIEILGGSIRVQSKPDNGTTFIVSLPYKKLNANIDQINSKIEDKEWKDVEIIIADNDNNMKELLNRIILKHKAIPIIANNYNELIEKIETSNNAKFVLFDFDFSIPNISQFVSYVKRKEKMKIIGMSSNIYLININRSNNIGFDYILAKPFSRREFEEVIESYLQ
ncbi:MAG: ATP-binding protein [Bacteroidales bacterium]|nr:ATP-binding protein [Bacteroidales bacterium]